MVFSMVMAKLCVERLVDWLPGGLGDVPRVHTVMVKNGSFVGWVASGSSSSDVSDSSVVSESSSSSFSSG